MAKPTFYRSVHVVCFSFFLLIGLLGGKAIAYAAITPEGAQHLTRMFEDMLQKQEEALGDEARLIKDGQIMVEEADYFYAVTLPHLSIKHADNSAVEIGIIALNVIPTDQPEQWKMSIALPTPITFFDKEGKPALVIKLGQQRAAGVWHEKFENFIKLDAKYQDIVITADKSDYSITVPKAGAYYNLTQNKEGLWSGPLSLELADMLVTIAEKAEVKIGGFRSSMKLFNYNIDTAYQYRQQIQALKESRAAGEASGSPEHQAAVYDLVADLISKVWDGFVLENRIKDFSIEVLTPEKRSLSLSEAGFNIGLRGFRQEAVTMTLSLNFDDLISTPVKDPLDPLLPHDLIIDLKIDRLPFNELRELGKGTLQSKAQMPQMAQLAALQALLSLPQIAKEAGLTVNVNKIGLSGEGYDMAAQGNLTATPEAAKGFTGQGSMTIQGLDRLIQRTESIMQAPGLREDKKQKLAQLRDQLARLQNWGQTAAPKGDNPAYNYKLALSKEGKLYLNGNELEPATAPLSPTP